MRQWNGTRAIPLNHKNESIHSQMWHKLTLRKRIYFLLTALIAIAVTGGLIIVWHTFQIQRLTSVIIEKNIAAFEIAQDLETALLNQKGFVTYYLLDRDPDWLRRLGEYRQIFNTQLDQAQKLAQNDAQKETIAQIVHGYTSYITLKDRVIDLYKAGEFEKGAQLHKTVRLSFFDIMDRCKKYKKMHSDQIDLARQTSRRKATRLQFVVVAVIVIQTLLVISLGVLFIRQILIPVNRLLSTTSPDMPAAKPENLVVALSRNVENLLQNADKARHELEKSRENLLQTEKMATVGKLAAGMAHSIRNPFTSVKMRLFSLSRSLNLDTDQMEDFEVISQEIRHIDTIVQNFLEFSRPPRLTMQRVSPSGIVDNAVRLLEHRLKSYGVTVDIIRSQMLPEVSADPEQLKEVLVNLIINACEAMGNGGTIVIDEQVSGQENPPTVVIRMSDSGPGIPESLKVKIFEPFFTTKEDGTGLGLSIASNILAEHGGSITLQGPQSGGATFMIELPIEESDNEHHFDHR
ncbi:MAG: ATP-binding protein [Desulfobacteraceae bacterium]